MGASPKDEQTKRLIAREARFLALADQLAATAEWTAAIMDDMANLHEAMAADRTHPLHVSAGGRAVIEREFADRERSAAIRFRFLTLPCPKLRIAGSRTATNSRSAGPSPGRKTARSMPPP